MTPGYRIGDLVRIGKNKRDYRIRHVFHNGHAKINADANRALKLPDVRERLAAVGAEAVGSTPEELATRIRDDSERYGKTVGLLKLKLD